MSIKTFVFVDLEGTGFPEKEMNQTKITELAFYAVSRRDLEEASVTDLPPIKKLTQLFNPERDLTSDAKAVTGFTREFLSDKPLFKDKIQSINEFLDLPKPVCLIAHGGSRFDFGVLGAEYNDAGASLPGDLMCLDTFMCFKSILPRSRYRSLSLRNIYRVMFNKEPEESHRAESDCLMLLKCVIGEKIKFLRYADLYRIRFTNIVPIRKRKS